MTEWITSVSQLDDVFIVLNAGISTRWQRAVEIGLQKQNDGEI